MAKKSPFSLKGPKGETLEIHLVRLADGRVVARTAEELQRADALAPGGTP